MYWYVYVLHDKWSEYQFWNIFQPLRWLLVKLHLVGQPYLWIMMLEPLMVVHFTWYHLVSSFWSLMLTLTSSTIRAGTNLLCMINYSPQVILFTQCPFVQQPGNYFCYYLSCTKLWLFEENFQHISHGLQCICRVFVMLHMVPTANDLLDHIQKILFL